MEADPILWLTSKRGPVGLSPVQFQEWTKRSGYDSWVQQVKQHKLNAINVFVTWEETIGVAEVNEKMTNTTVPSTENNDCENDDWALSTPYAQMIDISAERAQVDRSIIKRALDFYNSVLSNPTLTTADAMMWRERFSTKAWWTTWWSERGLPPFFCGGELRGLEFYSMILQ